MALSYIHGPSHIPLLGETIGAMLDRTTATYGDNEAIVSCEQGIRYTYAELRTQVERAARGFLSLGVERGTRIGIWSANSAEWLITQYAAAKTGAILVNINPAYRLRELDYVLQQSGISVLVTARGFRSTDYVGMLVELVPELKSGTTGALDAVRLPDLRHVVYLGVDPQPGGLAWPDLLNLGDDVRITRLRERESELQFDDPVNIQYTSGTTGSPKGATLSHHNILNNGFFVGEMLRYTDRDRICTPVPFYHCFGCVMANLAALTHGSTVVVPAPAFEAEATLRTIQTERCTSLYGVPTMFIAQLNHEAFDTFRLDSLRTGIMAGAPCPIEVMRQVMGKMHMPEVTIAYGMTETSPVSFQSAMDDPADLRTSTVGAVLPHLEGKIVDPETGKIVPRGTSGELCTRGYSIMLGYWNNEEATKASIDQAGWMHTGDLAVMREDNYVNIVGRSKDMILRGGENIYPREIEEFLYTHPKVADVQVIGVPDVKYGEEVCAWIRLREGVTITDEEIRDFCRGQIATYKIPRYIRFTTEFPTTVTGKIQKFKMREVSTAELGLGKANEVQTA